MTSVFAALLWMVKADGCVWGSVPVSLPERGLGKVRLVRVAAQRSSLSPLQQIRTQAGETWDAVVFPALRAAFPLLRRGVGAPWE